MKRDHTGRPSGSTDTADAAPGAAREPSIELTALSKRFGDKLAVDGLDLEIGRGEFFCFLGPNGAGKTTTIKMMTGLVRPTAGSVRIAGFDAQLEPLEARRRLGYVPDTPFLYDKLTGREFLRFVAGLYRMEEARARELAGHYLELFEVDRVADQLIENYSHGMRQKLSFAACFLHEPEVVVVDEPWVGLDPKNIHRVKRFLRRQADEEGLTVFMSTHTLSIAEEIADRIGIIRSGRLLRLGSVDDIKRLARRPGTLEDVFLELTEEEEEEAAPA
ncbi:MAG: ABC transporter ATP-binding protein [Acidobacteria bacterium]|nr:MAG: ABC transporter ATP-binding protein [Acidobacteriota bacterium]REK00250.1 MAG: ABC transporter ATP-binding protein [Acidobacteriota bacterium]